jgi:hypothetical protein
MDLIGLVMLALVHLLAPPTKDLTLTPGNVPVLSQPPVQSVSSDSGSELDPNGRN